MSRSQIYCKTVIFLFFVLGVAIPAVSQEQIAKTDSITKKDSSLWVGVSAKKLPEVKANALKFKPDPKKAVIYSLIFPGLGQIYNRKYWKLPIVYGGFIGLTYAITWNDKFYKDYSQAYADIMSSDPYKNDSWVQFLRPNITSAKDLTKAEIEARRPQFRNGKNFYRRYRDLSIIGMVVLYAACAIDAYVDAQLFSFDISDDVSMRIEPAVISSPSAYVANNALGVNCSIKF